MQPEPFVRLALAGGAASRVEAERVAAAALALVAGPLPGHPFDAAVALKRRLAGRGFRDHPTAFALPEMLARRAGNCLGLTLFVAAALLARGHAVQLVVSLNPLDDVHDAGCAFLARLHDPARGVDAESRLPDAEDRASRFRFAPLPHASLLLPGGGGAGGAAGEADAARPFESTNLVDLEVPPGWAPAAEGKRLLSFEELVAAVWCERAKARLASAPGDPAAWRAALALALCAVRRDAGHREAWAEVWQAARLLGRSRLAAAAMARFEAAGGDDSLAAFTRYRMSGDEAQLDRALQLLPSYAEAYLEKHVMCAARRLADAGLESESDVESESESESDLASSSEPDADLADETASDELRRRFIIAAWMFATSEVLDLEAMYRRHAALIRRLFGEDELSALLASFSGSGSAGANSRS